MDSLEAIRRDSDRFYATADGADASRAVSSCPGWDIAELVWHLGEVQWFWATIIETQADDPEKVEAAEPARPADYQDLVAWGRSQVDHLISVLEATPDDVSVWTWALDDADHTVGFIRRHQVQEAAVHRWDIQQAANGSPDAIEPDVASDSIDELLAITLPWCINEKKPFPGTVHLHCTDVEGEWFIHTDGRVQRLHSKGDVAIRGAAADLLLAIYDRAPLDRLDIVGDASLAEKFVETIDMS